MCNWSVGACCRILSIASPKISINFRSPITFNAGVATVSAGNVAAYAAYGANDYTTAGVNTDVTAVNPAPESLPAGL